MEETFAEFYDRVMGAYQDQRFAEALALIQREGGRYPEEQSLLLYLQSCLAARIGEIDSALALLSTALDQGYWYGERVMRESPSWKVLQGHPVFEQLAAVSIERQQRYGGQPERFVELPAGGQAQQLPLLMTLHGNGDRGSASLAGWRAAAEEGWLVAALQSSQANAAEAYVWDDQELALREIAQHYAELRDRHELDVRQIVIAGFSMGGETALRAALGGVVPASGFVLLGPGGPTIDIAEDWLPLIANARGSGLRGYILIGERDTTIPHDAIRELVGLLQEGGIPCELEILPGLHHEYPRDPAPFLRALRFVRQAG